MNEPPTPPFDAVGDEHVEARIVAWVLGEASAFEIAELERLCEERPELDVFHRRMQALHGLLGEAAGSESDPAWQLPAAKRQPIDEKFGGGGINAVEEARDERVRRGGWRALVGLAACLMLTVVVGGIFSAGGGKRRGTVSARESQKNEPESLAQAIRDQEEKVEERRKALVDIVRSRGIIYRGPDSFYNHSGVDEDKGAKDALDSYNSMLTQKLNLESQVNSLTKYDVDQLMGMSGLDIPENITKNLYPKYLEETRRLSNLKKSGLENSDPAVEAAAQEVDAMKRQLDEGVVNSRATLQARLDLTSDQLKHIEGMKDDTREEAIKRGLDAQDYVEAKRNFETDQALLQTLKLKQVGERMTGAVPAEPAVIHEDSRSGKSLAIRSADTPPAPPASPAGPVEWVEKPAESRPTLAKTKGIDIAGGTSFALAADEAAPQAGVEEVPAKAFQSRITTALSDSESTAGEKRKGLKMGASVHGGKSQVPEQQPAEPAAVRLELALDTKPSEAPAGEVSRFSDSFEKPKSEAPLDSLARRDATRFKQAKLSGGLGGAAAAGGPGKDSQEQEWSSRDESVKEPVAMAGQVGGDFVSPVNGTTVAGIPADPAEKALTYGLRSGDEAINRNSIDAILNNPNRVAGQPWAGKDLPTLAAKDTDAAPPPVLGGQKVAEADSEEAIRTNPALTFEHTQNVDQVRRGLYIAEGNLNLGKYDDAKREYEKVLRTDKYNFAARRGLEKVDAMKADYYRAAYDHTRAEMLSPVDSAWELKVPAATSADNHFGTYTGYLMDSGRQTSAGEAFTKAMGLNGYSLKNADDDQHTVIAGKLMKLDAGLAKAFTESLDGASKEEGIEITREYDYKDLGDSHPEPRKPAVNPVDLMDEIAAAENPYSTFSLNISDASFQVAKAALAKGERPDPEAIKVEQFYNAVDYGDPAPAAGEPVAAAIEQAAHPLIPGRNLVRVALRTASAGRAAAQPLRLTLLVDQSGSMVREDRRTAMEQAVKQLGGLLTANDKITVIGFSRIPHLLKESMSGDEGAKLDGLINQTASEGGTNLEEAIKLGAQLAERHQLADAQNRIVLFTDGAANLGNADSGKLANQVKALRQKGIAFDIAGIGADGLNDRLLSELARHGNGRYYVVGDAKDQSFARQLAGAFRPAAENVKVQVNFNPQRVGRYKLIGFEKDRLNKEDFRNDAVDAAELAADEAGVAIYQVEPLAGGAGEIGEVSVRFRDTASGEMVERAWTIPNQTAPAFDRATPSMQLAGLAMLAGEKLKGGPLADATDFKRLAGSQAKVKQFFGSSARVGEMLQVIDALK